jgi:hypothetical protein
MKQIELKYLDDEINTLQIHERYNELTEFGKNKLSSFIEIRKQLMLGGVASSSDLIVVELSDDELKIITMAELEQWKQSAIEFDGFEGWIVRGRLIK